MGIVHEKTANRDSVFEGDKATGRRPADYRHSAGGVGRRQAASAFCGSTGAVERGRITGGQSSMGGDSSRGVRAGGGSVAGTSSVHREKVGRGRQEKTGTKIMKTLVTAIQKGGQGKTFATCHLAFDFQERGLRVAVIDLDTQGNASWTLAEHDSGYPASSLFMAGADELKAWFSGRENSGLSLISADAKLANLDKMSLGEAAGAFRESIEALGEFFDVCLIDTAPSLGVAMTAAVLAADYMLSPIEMEAYSLQGMKKMVAVIGNLRRQNPKLRFLGMVPNKVDARKPRHVANLEVLQKAYPQLVLPFSVGARDSIAQALGEQVPVWKIRKTAARKASQEVRELADYVFTKMEIAQ